MGIEEGESTCFHWNIFTIMKPGVPLPHSNGKLAVAVAQGNNENAAG